MQFFLSLDGLSTSTFDVLLEFLPRSASVLKSLNIYSVDGIFTTPQPIWSEFLTASKWFDNGCSSYAKPNGSLNRLEVFSEPDLLVPTVLVSDRSALLNIPILRPNAKTRVWFSDGSLPLNKTVVPESLKSEQPFSSYMSRPFTSIVTANGSLDDLAIKCLEVESNRLKCALALLKRRNWSRFFHRITLFDQMAHLYGVNFLSCKDLSIFAHLKKFLSDLDDAIVDVAAASDNGFFVLSCFSHVMCRGSLNLNKVLQSTGLFTSENSSNDSHDERIAATSAVYKFMPVNAQSSSMESQVGGKTVAASPTAGCIFINRKDVFENGSVTRDEFNRVRNDVGKIMRQVLFGRFGHHFHMEENPIGRFDTAGTPDFVVKIDGVEFNNVRDYAPTPRTTHSSAGFVLASPQFGIPYNSQISEIGALLAQTSA